MTAHLQGQAQQQGFTLEEVEQHNTEQDCWIIIKQRVRMESRPLGCLCHMQMHMVHHCQNLLPWSPHDACAPQIAQAHPLCLVVAEAEEFSCFSISLAEVLSSGSKHLQSICNPGLHARTVFSKRAPRQLCASPQVYDVSDWTDQHPGGQVILSYGGRDATDVFSGFHAASTWRELKHFHVGHLTVSRSCCVLIAWG